MKPSNPQYTAAGILAAGTKHMADRAKQRDAQDGERSMAATVNAFNAIYDHNLTEEQGWWFMAILKQVRASQGEFNIDDYEDAAAYVALAGESVSPQGVSLPGHTPASAHTPLQHPVAPTVSAPEAWGRYNKAYDEYLADCLSRDVEAVPRVLPAALKGAPPAPVTVPAESTKPEVMKVYFEEGGSAFTANKIYECKVVSPDGMMLIDDDCGISQITTRRHKEYTGTVPAGFILWEGGEGGECPVDGDPLVEVMLRNGYRGDGEANCWTWGHDNEANDLIAYRIVDKQAAPEA